MNLINKWAELIFESDDTKDIDCNFVKETKDRIGISMESDLGKKICNIINPDILAHRNDTTKDLFDADFKCNITDSNYLVKRYPRVSTKNLPNDTMFMYFICKHNTLKIERMINYINTTCSDVLPRKIVVNEAQYLGSFYPNYDKTVSYDIFILDINNEINVHKNDWERNLVKDSFSTIKDGYKSEALKVRYGDITFLKQFFISNPSIIKKLEPNKPYLVLFALKDKLPPEKIVKVANEIISSSNIFNGQEIQTSDIINVGIIQLTQKSSGHRYDFDVFAIKG